MTSTGPKEALFPPALLPFAARVERRIDELLREELARWEDVDLRLAEPIDALRDFVATGGKRLRPAFCYCAYAGAGGALDDPRVIDASAALELVHTFALAHDDVMDGSAMRRGEDSVHARFARRHGRAGWRGEARRFGEGMAILVGDFALTYADVLMRGMPTDTLMVYDELRVELCVGQSLDLVGTASASTDGELANRIAVYKSGKYTVERPLHMGAALAGGLERLAPALTAIGLPLGHAFQLRDDVLGAFGDAEITGKPVGDDLREGKPTPLVALAFERARADDRRVLERLGDPRLTAGEIASVQDVLVRTGALEQIESDIARLVADAREALAAAPITDDARGWLDELAAYVAWRDR
jgi:geranylgeranyl diphosphate synthase type I